MAWKYIVIDIGLFELPVIFSDKLVHADVAHALVGQMRALSRDGNFKVVSAGMIDHIGPIYVHGTSETLNIKSRKNDEELIANFSYLHGVK